jgi:tetratricopeptide (TPR) repeat protein
VNQWFGSVVEATVVSKRIVLVATLLIILVVLGRVVSITRSNSGIADDDTVGSISALFRAALQFEEQSKESDALHAWEETVNLIRKEFPAYGDRRFMGMEPENLAYSLHALTVQIRSNKVGADWLIDRGFVFASLQAYQLAENDFTAGLELAPNSAESHLYRGITRNQLRQYADAIDDLTQAIALDVTPKHPLDDTLADAYMFRGLSKLMLHRSKDAALSDLNKAVEVSKIRKEPFQTFINQLGHRSVNTKIRVHLDHFESPDYSTWVSENAKESIRSFYLYRGIREPKPGFRVFWELRL